MKYWRPDYHIYSWVLHVGCPLIKALPPSFYGRAFGPCSDGVYHSCPPRAPSFKSQLPRSRPEYPLPLILLWNSPTTFPFRLDLRRREVFRLSTKARPRLEITPVAASDQYLISLQIALLKGMFIHVFFRSPLLKWLSVLRT